MSLTDRKNKKKAFRFFLIGIGGCGMSPLAHILVRLGHHVSGSDQWAHHVTEQLEKSGVTVYEGHSAEHVEDADIVVYSHAIGVDHVELQAARALQKCVMTRARLLAELMQLQRGIAVVGTHGKTTVSALIAYLLVEGGMDPTAVIGGRLPDFDHQARLGKGDYLVAEADESDDAFLAIRPDIAVVTNIDHDHLEQHRDDFSVLRDRFLQVIETLPFYGMGFVCMDDRNVSSLCPQMTRPFLTYGCSASADFRAENIRAKGGQTHFSVKRPRDMGDLNVKLNMMGTHNALNALAAIAVASYVGVDDAVICSAMARFRGIDRRLQVWGELSLEATWTETQAVRLIEDYGHHPTEIVAVLKTLQRHYPHRRCVLAFQPHRYSRLKRLYRDFVNVLASSSIGQLLLLDVYAAGEQVDEADVLARLGADIAQLSHQKPCLVKKPSDLPDALSNCLQPGDILLVQGAGDITTVCPVLMARWGQAFVQP